MVIQDEHRANPDPHPTSITNLNPRRRVEANLLRILDFFKPKAPLKDAVIQGQQIERFGWRMIQVGRQLYLTGGKKSPRKCLRLTEKIKVG